MAAAAVGVVVVVVVFLAAAVDGVAGKDCTNGFPGLTASHTERAAAAAELRPDGEVEAARVLDLLLPHGHGHGDDHDGDRHLTPTDESTWMSLMPRRLLASPASSPRRDAFDWLMLYRNLRGSGSGAGAIAASGGALLAEASLHDVRLQPGTVYWQAQQTNLEYLLLLDVDRLVWSFRTQAGLPASGAPYGGWEGPGVELRGHFVGHYLSATAKMWASTHNDTLQAKMSSVVDALHDCQKKMGSGYLSAFPSEFFDRVESIKAVWAPYYTIHKIMQGLLDQYTVAGNSKALDLVVGMANYFSDRVKNVIQKYSIERHWASLNEESGGMNDVLYQLYTITNDQKHLTLAHLFDKPCFLGLLAVQADSISGFHSNTHIPVVIGAQMRYEVTGDLLYKQIATFFMDTINSSHSYATGGTSAGEFWTNPKRLADTLSTENEESCTTYNMLKVSRNLFRWTKELSYADYYERALINGVLSIQRGTDPGVMIYMLPQAPGRSKAVSYHGWGTKYDSFWCCYGTGIESFSKLGDSIYFEEKGDRPVLNIIQYIPSAYNWKAAGLTVNQQLKPISSLDMFLQVSLSTSAKTNGQSATLNVRIPSWTSANGAKATLNDNDLGLMSPGSFLSISKQWNSDDHLSLQFPITLRTEAIKDDRPEYASLQAILFGPFVLAGLSTGDWNAEAGNTSAISDWISPVPSSYNSQLVTFTQESSGKTFVLSSANGSLAMQERPTVDGTDTAIHATFRVHPQDSAGQLDTQGATLKGTSVQIEPFDLPGTVITNNLTQSAQKSSDSLFNIVPGLVGNPNSVSLELGTKPGCFLVTGVDYSVGTKIQVSCKSSLPSINGIFEQAASFVQAAPLRQYHPISFIAKGVKRNFLLEPLYSLRDEFYTVYFNLGA
uniref:Alpha-L-arabinofuranosidase B arabinose-binding domain-containing protein n=1 Tax=Oryza nivara TaxID=4536 RepID=A0A0E0G396_ORYNI